LWPAGFIDTYVDPASTGDTLPAGSHDLLTYGILASAPEAIDPMERAFHDLGQRHPDVIAPLRDGRWRIRHAYGLQPDLLAMSQVWQRGDDTAALVVATKGAPETIAALCRLSPNETAAVLQSVNQMAAAGMRVLGVGRADFSGDVLPATQRDFAFTFLGLVGLSDPLRPSARAAVADCHAAGIRVIMITGDYPATAAAIATQAGLTTIDVVTGDDLASLGVDALAHRLRQATIFARVMPEQKLRIVEALKANGEVVAMTGDGVNDAPSLKAAHIGIAMGGRGTDVAREASAIVLLDDDLGSVVKAISLGRRIYDNLRKAMGFIFAVHVPIAGLALLPLAFGLPIIFSPIHIAFLEMVIDPVCSLVFEAETEEADVMRRPPRPTGTPVFTGRLIAWSLLQGFITFLVLAGFYLVALHRGMPEAETRALTFFTLVLTIVGLIFVNRTFSVSPGTALRRPNKMLGGVLLMVTAMLSVTLGWPVAGTLFRFGPLHGDDIGLAIAATLGLFILLEGLKRLWRAHLAF
jgi:Ca2+-transporting ATPase